MRTFPLVLTIIALSAMFIIADYSAFGLSLPAVMLVVVLVAGLIASLLPFRYYGWPYAEKGKFRDITEEQLLALLNGSRGVKVVDVRTKREYEHGHIPGAVNRPLMAIRRGERYPEPTVFVCLTGHRSRMALRKVDGPELYNLDSGYRKWTEANFPVERGSMQK